MQLSAQTIVEICGLVGTLLVGGMKFGALDNRVAGLEQRKDQTEDVATVRQQVSDLTNDVHDMKSDIRDIKRMLPRVLSASR